MSITLITLLFHSFLGISNLELAWLAKIQFLPAILALNFGVLAFLLILTFIFGRIYCSVICPLGIFQDSISWINGNRKNKRLRFSYSPALNTLRFGVLFLFVLALIAGIGAIFALLDPYGIYGRITQNIFPLFWLWGNNLLSFMSNQNFFSTNDISLSLPIFSITLITFITLIILAWKNGRTYCNTVCPIGTLLGFLSKYSLFRITIDSEKCKKCSLCAKGCKASCINFKDHQVDNSRCVSCMNCLDTCSHGAIGYNLHYIKSDRKSDNSVNEENVDKLVNSSRRQLLSFTSFILITPLLKAQKKMEKGFAIISNKKIYDKRNPIVPAGSIGLNHLSEHCTACQLCVSVCPSRVLRPSDNWETLMQPSLSYELGYCSPDCTKCADVCPTNAIKKITADEKSFIQIGYAVFIKENCIEINENKSCDICIQNCPLGAIIKIKSISETKNSTKTPYINIERCIGCGTCENLCPTQPKSIYVEGHKTHKII